MSHRATVGRQDIPAQDKEMSVTICYAKGKEGERASERKDTFCSHCVFVCTAIFVCRCVTAQMYHSTHDMRVGKAPL